MAQRPAWNQLHPRIAALAAGLFALNVYVCRELFHIEYLRHMGSIEALFITLARYARDNRGDLLWFPLWYGGIPFQNTYPPFLPALVSGVSTITGWSPALAYHATVAFFYCAGPVLLFLLCCRISHLTTPSFFAGVIYSVTAPAAFLIPNIYGQLHSFLRPFRLQTLVLYGEGPHIAGLALVTFSILLLDIAAQKRRAHYYVLTALAFAATVLTNWLAAAALAIAVMAYLLACARFPYWRYVLAAAGAGVLAYAFAAPWIPPSTIHTFQFNSQTIEGDYRQYARLLPVRVITLIAALGAAKFAFIRLRASPTLQFGAYFTIVTAAIAMAWAYARVVIVPQPHRYTTEMELGLAVLIPFALAPLASRMPRGIQIASACIFLLAAVPFAEEHRRFARDYIDPIDITQRIEFKSAQWIDRHLHGSRVFVPGSTMYWLNMFTDTPQLGGADDQGTTNFLTRVAEYVITTSYLTGDRDAEISLAWLQAFGVAAIEIGGPKSAEVYKPFQKPLKFAGVLKELWRDGDDVIYAVPQRSPSLAHVLLPSDLPARAPIHGLDIEPLKRYVAAIEDASLPSASLRWTSRHSAEIRGDLRPEQILSAQIAYHPGWRATANGRTARTYADHLGQLVIEAGCNGLCTVELNYDGGLEMRLARIACWLALAGSAIWIVLARYRR